MYESKCQELLNKYDRMLNKYQHLLIQESMVGFFLVLVNYAINRVLSILFLFYVLMI